MSNLSLVLLLIISLLNVSKISADNYIDTYNLKAMVKKQWEVLLDSKVPFNKLGPPGVLWRSSFTPPFPKVWPPQQLPQSVYYGYPRGFSPRMHHSEKIGKPWVKVIIQTNKLRKIEYLFDEIKEIDTESMWYPYFSDKVRNIYKHNANAPKLVSNLTHSSLKNLEVRKRIKGYYCQWSKNKPISMVIEKSHKEFYVWLNCK